MVSGSKSLYVGHAQKKADREKLLRLQFFESQGRHFKTIQVTYLLNCIFSQGSIVICWIILWSYTNWKDYNHGPIFVYQGSNVYVKNLDDSVDDKALLEYFAGCGKIISTKVMHDKNGQSRGFGFVSFFSPKEASNAVAKLNGIKLYLWLISCISCICCLSNQAHFFCTGAMFHGRHLYVAIAQHKEDHHKALQLHFANMPVRHAVHFGLPSVYYTTEYGQLQNSGYGSRQNGMGNFLGNQYFEIPNQIKQQAYATANCANKVPITLQPKNDPFVCQFHHPVYRGNLLPCLYNVQVFPGFWFWKYPFQVSFSCWVLRDH